MRFPGVILDPVARDRTDISVSILGTMVDQVYVQIDSSQGLRVAKVTRLLEILG